MANTFVTKENLTRFKTKLDEKLQGKVSVEEGKGLSSNDYTAEEKQKLAGLQNYTLTKASADTLGGVKVGTGLQVSEDGTLSADAVDWANVQNKPTILTQQDVSNAFSTSLEAAHLATSAELSAVEAKLTGVYHFKGSVDTFDALPKDAADGDVYNVTDSGMNYGYIAESKTWDALGTVIDLSGYAQKTDFVAMTNEEIDALFA
jgi:hypothetical protein